MGSGIKYGVGPAGANGNRMGDGLWDPGCSVSASDLSPFVYQSKVPSSGEIVGGRRLGQLAKGVIEGEFEDAVGAEAVRAVALDRHTAYPHHRLVCKAATRLLAQVQSGAAFPIPPGRLGRLTGARRLSPPWGLSRAPQLRRASRCVVADPRTLERDFANRRNRSVGLKHRRELSQGIRKIRSHHRSG